MSNKKKINILSNIFKNKNFSSIINKIRNRLEPDTTLEAITWAKKNKIDLEFFCKSKNQKLWNECLIEFSIIKKDILLKLKVLEFQGQYQGLVEKIGLQLESKTKK